MGYGTKPCDFRYFSNRNKIALSDAYRKITGDYLLPSLLGLGTWPATLLTGALHGLWHFPVILLTPYYHGAGSQWIVLPEFLLVLTLAGVLYGYLRLSTASLWPAILLHASVNESIAFYALHTRPTDPALLEYWGGESGVYAIVAILLVVIWIRWQWRPSPLTACPPSRRRNSLARTSARLRTQ